MRYAPAGSTSAATTLPVRRLSRSTGARSAGTATYGMAGVLITPLAAGSASRTLRNSARPGWVGETFRAEPVSLTPSVRARSGRSVLSYTTSNPEVRANPHLAQASVSSRSHRFCVEKECRDVELECRACSLGKPHQTLRENRGTFVVRLPPLERTGRLIDDPILRHAVPLIARALHDTIEARRRRRDNLGGEQELGNEVLLVHELCCRHHEQVGLRHESGLELYVHRGGQGASQPLGAYVLME